jgi:hypothetical protein
MSTTSSAAFGRPSSVATSYPFEFRKRKCASSLDRIRAPHFKKTIRARFEPASGRRCVGSLAFFSVSADLQMVNVQADILRQLLAELGH